MNRSHQPSHPDLIALLEDLPSDEARRLQEVWSLAAGEEPVEVPAPEDVEAAAEHLEAALDASGQRASSEHLHANGVSRGTQNARRSRSGASLSRVAAWRWAAAAAVAAVLLAAGLFWWTRPATWSAPAGERLAVTLPDGSAAHLNSGSTLRYSEAVRGVRRVYLQGEAFFEVDQTGRPFVVETFNAKVEVTGTRFNVRAWTDAPAPRTLVTLESGVVHLAALRADTGRVTLMPGDSRQVLGDGGGRSHIEPVDVSVSEATAWRRGDLVFKDRSLGLILTEVERRFALDLTVNPPSLRSERLSLALRRPESGEVVVRDIAMALGLHYRKTATGFEIYRPAE